MATLKEVITQETTTQIIKENLNFYYKADETLSTWLANRIIVVFTPYFNMDLILPVEDAKAVYAARLYEFLPELLMNLRVEKQKFKDTFLNDDGTAGVIKQSGKTKVSYSGYNVANQDGDYSGTNTESTTTGSQTLNYMMYLEAPFKKWSQSLKDSVLESIIKLIY